MSDRSNLIVFRKPLRERIGIAVLAAIVVIDLTVGLVMVTADRSPATLGILLMLAWSVAYLGRAFRIAVEIREDGLVVRNWVRTYRVERGEIAGFRVGPARFDPVGEAIYLTRRTDKPIEMTVTKRFGLSRRGRDQLEERLRQLQAWMAQETDVQPAGG